MLNLNAKTLTVAMEEKGASSSFCLWIRTSAGPEIGFGHLRRSLILARSLYDCGIPLFLVDRQDRWSQEQIASGGFPFASAEFHEIWSLFPKPGAILIDTRQEDGLDQLIKDAQNRGVPVISIHDLGLNPLPSDIVIDGSIAPMTQNFPNQRATFFGGLPYQILDPAYSLLRQFRQPLRDKIHKVVINLGGGDSSQYFEKVLQGLRLWERNLEVAGLAGFASWGQETLGQRQWRPLHFHWENSSFDKLLIQADLAITAGGLAAYEALSAGIPLIAFSRDRFQQITVTKLAQEGACIDLGLGDQLDPNRLPEILSMLESNLEMQASLSCRGTQLVDGRGAQRVSNVIRQLIQSDSCFRLHPQTSLI